MIEFQKISKNNLKSLKELLTGLGSGANSFRYFRKRAVEIVLDHLYAVLLIKDGLPVAYGHLEYEDSTLWLGIAVVETYQGNGFGKQMIQHLVDFAKQHAEHSISLTVDKTNYKAIQLYETQGFIRELEKENIYQYSYSIS